VSEIAAEVERPERVCGMHFFNPPVLMRLVEVVAGRQSSTEALDAVTEVAQRMGREPVRAGDAVGFIANRCNRPFTLEALAMLGEGVAGHEQIDAAVRERGDYRMGPFELMDLIGIDVSFRVARSFFEQRPEPRWRPHPIQERMVASGRLGRKTGHGFYEYPPPSERAAAATGEPGEVAREQLEALAGAGWITDLESLIVGRIVAQLVNEASFAVGEGVATPEDVDTATRLGLNHPRGPFEWARRIGPARVLALLEALGGELGADRYAAAPSLRRWAVDGSLAP
jgi:3-hydroxybutyryl-CoA dehydrogenase